MNRRAFVHLPTRPQSEDLFTYWARQAPSPLPPASTLFPFAPRRAQTTRQTAAKLDDPKPLNIQAGLEPFDDTLDLRQTLHLLRRAGSGAHSTDVAALMGHSAEEVVDELVDAALDQAMPEPPVWADEGFPREQAAQQAYINELNPMWLTEYYATLTQQMYDGGLHERMTLFWLNHFVTEIDTYIIAPVAYRYVTTLRAHALGNFKDFVHAMGLDLAMLVYLNGAQSRVGEPNENYGRELLELFTMGQFDEQGNKNYTQSDIEEVARALTGWLIDPFELTVQLVSLFHDHGEKTIFGRTGHWGYDDVIDILFEERGEQIAAFIVRKLYKEFIYAAPDEAVVADLAQIFIDNDFEIAPVVRTILKSAHFHDEQVIGAQIKAPIHMMTTLLHETDTTPSDSLFLLLYYAGAVFMEQNLLDPPNVKGWPGHHTWVTTSSLPNRWFVSEALIFGVPNGPFAFPPLDLVGLGETLLAAKDDQIDPNNPASVFDLATVLAERLMPVPLESLDLNPPELAGDLSTNPIPDEVTNGPAHVLALAKIFLLGEFPWYEWSLDHMLALPVLQLYTRYLTQTPEFQLT